MKTSLDSEQRFKALAALWVALLLWGTHGPSGRYLALRGVPILGVMAARTWIGCLIYGIVLLASKKLNLGFLKGSWKGILVFTVVGVYLNMVTFHAGMNYLPATYILLLENLAPFFVIFLVWILEKKRPTSLQFICQSLAFTGLIIIISGRETHSNDSSEFTLGVLLEICAAITWAIYSYFSGRWVNQLIRDDNDKFSPALNFTFVVFIITGIISIPHLFSLKATSLQTQDFITILLMGIFPTASGFLLWNYALGTLPVTMASTMLYMTVVFTCINESIFLGFKLNSAFIIGSVFILGSAIKLTVSKSTASRSPSH